MLMERGNSMSKNSPDATDGILGHYQIRTIKTKVHLIDYEGRKQSHEVRKFIKGIVISVVSFVLGEGESGSKLDEIDLAEYQQRQEVALAARSMGFDLPLEFTGTDRLHQPSKGLRTKKNKTQERQDHLTPRQENQTFKGTTCSGPKIPECHEQTSKPKNNFGDDRSFSKGQIIDAGAWAALGVGAVGPWPGAVVEAWWRGDGRWYPAVVEAAGPGGAAGGGRRHSVRFLGYGNREKDLSLISLRACSAESIAWIQSLQKQTDCTEQEEPNKILLPPAQTNSHVKFEETEEDEIDVREDSQARILARRGISGTSEEDSSILKPKPIESTQEHFSKEMVAAANTGDEDSDSSAIITTFGEGSSSEDNSSSSGEDEERITTTPRISQNCAKALVQQQPSSSEDNVTEQSGNMPTELVEELSRNDRKVPRKRKRKGQKKKRRNAHAISKKDESPFPDIVDSRYWAQRYTYFSLYNEGILMDKEGWYSVTPEALAKHHAERCRCDVVIDMFAGCGGNAIQLAFTCNQVFAIDIDPEKLRCAKHNAEIYGVQERIEFILGDATKIIPFLKADVIFVSPPWGGPEYLKAGSYDFENMIACPLGGKELLELLLQSTSSIALFLPRNTDDEKFQELTHTFGCQFSGPIEIEENHLNNKLKAKTYYFGSFLVGEEDDDVSPQHGEKCGDDIHPAIIDGGAMITDSSGKGESNIIMTKS